MNRYTAARRFKSLPRWIRMLVYNLTGWQVQRMTIRRTQSSVLFGYTTERVAYVWSRAKREVCK